MLVEPISLDALGLGNIVVVSLWKTIFDEEAEGLSYKGVLVFDWEYMVAV